MATRELKVGFLPLVDACLPILAQEHGFAEDEGLHLTFVKDVSWATVLDRLLYGHTDMAHMLAPLAIATTLGRGRPAQPLAAPFVLGLNGNAVTLSMALAERVGKLGSLNDPVALGASLKLVVDEAKAAGKPLRLGVVHRHSSHNYKLRYWLAACDIQPDKDVEIVVIPPPFVADALENGEVDGACVGEPWNSICVDREVGAIVLFTAQIWRRGVEKVLAMRESVLDERREDTEALIRAMRLAGAHFVDPANFEENCRVLAAPEYLASSPNMIRQAVTDNIILTKGAAPIHFPDFMFQHSEAANFPWVSQAAWLYSQMVRWGPLEYSSDDSRKAAATFRPDIYRSALSTTDDDLPGANSKVEGSVTQRLQVSVQQGAITLSENRFFDGRSFDPEQIESYLAALP